MLKGWRDLVSRSKKAGLPSIELGKVCDWSLDASDGGKSC
jgi:hypothetical protein